MNKYINKMKKSNLKMIGLKLDPETMEMIKTIMKNRFIRTYTEVIKYCLFNRITIIEYYNEAKNLN